MNLKKALTIGSLFAGIGGFDLAGRWMGWETKWFSEIEPYASAVLKKHWPNVPNHGDITKIKGEDVEHVDILCGGFPCQDISLAGKGAGLAGERSGLWSHYARLIEEIRPKYVVAENVSALRSRGLDRVLGEISALGYDAEWHCIPASAVGAPHRRDRIWIVAYARSVSDELGRIASIFSRAARAMEGGEGLPQLDPADSGGENVADACGEQQHLVLMGSGGEGSEEAPSTGPMDADDHDRCTAGVRADATGDSASQGLSHGLPRSLERSATVAESERSGWWEIEPAVGRVAHGIPRRVDRLRCLGNAIVPQVAHLIFQGIARHEEMAIRKNDSGSSI